MLNVQLKVIETTIWLNISSKSKLRFLDNTSNQDRRTVSDTQAGAVPEKYVVVTSNELVRVKYILIYSEPNELLQYEWLIQMKFTLFSMFMLF